MSLEIHIYIYIYIYIYVSINSNHKCCIEGGLINFNYKRNLAFRIILAFFPSLVANVLRHNHLIEPGVEGRKVTSQLRLLFKDGAIPSITIILRTIFAINILVNGLYTRLSNPLLSMLRSSMTFQ